jgi:16S rRNA (guanine527-N7)-methyltransferase
MMTPQDFQATLAVSDSVLDRLTAYADLLVKWQARINLVGPDTLPDLWRRHLLDSAQLFARLPPAATRLADLGSGAGFPGLVLAIMGAPDVHLVESDTRKCVFMREVARVAEVTVTVHTARIEKVPSLQADVVTSRALAPLDRLLTLAHPHLVDGGKCLFLKGRAADDELTAARKEWIITVDRAPSLSDPSGIILEVGDIRRGRA